MSGEPTIRLDAPADSVVARCVNALARFPADEPWVLIGGIAVFIRLGSVTRPTADADTVARSQAHLLDRLAAEDPTVLVANGDVTIPVAGVPVEVDVMDLADEPLPPDAERRAFALARRVALESAVRRPHSNHPAKVGSDIHDLIRLVNAAGAQDVGVQVAAADPELAQWMATQIETAFGKDLRYTIVRLRRHDRSAAAQALGDDDIAGVAILADVIHDEFAH